jgi:hypothetical protein
MFAAARVPRNWASSGETVICFHVAPPDRMPEACAFFRPVCEASQTAFISRACSMFMSSLTSITPDRCAPSPKNRAPNSSAARPRPMAWRA